MLIVQLFDFLPDIVVRTLQRSQKVFQKLSRSHGSRAQSAKQAKASKFDS